MPKNIMIIAGESSGDLHAAELISAAKTIDPSINFFGMGGIKMRTAGANIIIDNKLAFIGIIEPLLQIRAIYKVFKQIKHILITQKPDLLILVDYPAFNLRIAKYAHKQQVKTLYYISPQLWAWKPGRIKIIKQCITQMAVIFPFEVDFYRSHGIKALYVGNSVIKNVHANIDKTTAYKKFALDPKKPIVAILPGSRNSEIKHNFATLLKTVQLLKRQKPEIQFVLPLANSLDQTKIQKIIENNKLDIKVIPNQLYNLLQLCDAALAVSGTVTLETALMGVPFIIVYKLSPISFWIGRLLVKIDKIGLCNVVAGKKIVPEFIQYQAKPEILAANIINLLENELLRKQMQNDFKQLRFSFANKAHCDVGEVVTKLLQ